MNDQDWAVVVGVSVYPGLGDLDGPENDARDFYAWATSPQGGGVQAAQAKLILSTDFTPPFESTLKARPTVESVEQFFEQLDDLANQNSDDGLGLQVGRRLYMFFAGHGFAPTLDDSALLMANATRTRVRHHIPGRPWANWFYRAGYFQEVLLFMDCCREEYPKAPLNVPLFIDITSPDAVERGKRFYAFATKWSRLSRERKMPDGKVHGVFTATLLAGLRGGACEPSSGNITALTLTSFLYNNMKKFFDPAELDNAQIPTEPDVFGPNTPSTDFVIANVQPPTFTVRINTANGSEGKEAQIIDNRFKAVFSTVLSADPWKVALGRGTYMILVAGQPAGAPFEVSGVGEAGGEGVIDVSI